MQAPAGQTVYLWTEFKAARRLRGGIWRIHGRQPAVGLRQWGEGWGERQLDGTVGSRCDGPNQAGRQPDSCRGDELWEMVPIRRHSLPILAFFDERRTYTAASDQRWCMAGQYAAAYQLAAPGIRSAIKPAVEVAEAAAAPWAIIDRLLPAPPARLQIRSALFMDDSLNRALGQAQSRPGSNAPRITGHQSAGHGVDQRRDTRSVA